MSATTDFLDLSLPTVGGDQDAWGDLLNADLTDIDEAFRSLVEAGNYGAGSGADTITLSLNPAPQTLRTGLGVAWKQASDNTTSPTLNVNGLGAKSITFTDGTALAAGDLKANAIYVARYDGTQFTISGVGTATATETAGSTSKKAITPASAAAVRTTSINEQAIGGLYTKSGSASVTSNTGGSTTGAATVTFPNAFPNGCDSITALVSLSGGGSSGVIYSPWAASASTTGFTLGITRAGVGSDGPFTVYWRAEGR